MHRIGFQIILVIAGIMLVASLGFLLHGRAQLERLGADIDETYQKSVRAQAETFIARLAREQANRYDSRFADYLFRVELMGSMLKDKYEDLGNYPEDGGFAPNRYQVLHGNGIWTTGADTAVASLYWGSPELNEPALRDLRAISGVDPLLQRAQSADDLVTAAWTITALGSASYAPNVEPASYLPEGFDLRDPESDPSYSVGAPESNPEGETRFGRLYMDVVGNGVMVSAITPVYTADGTFRASLGVDIALREMREEILRFHSIAGDESSFGFAFMVDQDGRAIAFPEERLPLIGLERPDELLNLNLRESSNEELQALVSRMLVGQTGVELMALGQSSFYVAYHPLQSTGWSLGLAYPESDLLEASIVTQAAIRDSLHTHSTDGAAVTLLGLVVMGILITLFVNRRLVRPILELNLAAQHIGAGDLKRDIPIQGSDELGKLGRNLSSMRDAVRHSLERVQASERLMAAVIDNASAVISLKDPEGRYIRVNNKFTELFGGEPEEYTGRLDDSLFAPGSGRFRSELKQVLEQRSPVEFAEQVVHSDGEVRSYITLQFPLEDAAANIYAICSISTDITDQKRQDEERLEEENRRKMAEEARRKSAEKTRDYLQALNTRIEEKSRQVRQLLDNSGQGFFSFGHNLLVEPEYSREGARIFDELPAGRDITTLLFPERPDRREFFATVIRRALGEIASGRQKLYLSLLPKEFEIGLRSYRAEYNLGEDGMVILILTDITQEKQLRELAEAERSRLEFVVSVVSDSRDVFDIIAEFEVFISDDCEQILRSKTDTMDKLAELYRRVHTFKGGFDQIGFLHIPKVLHELEVQLSDLGGGDTPPTESELSDLMHLDGLSRDLHKDIAVLEEVLGKPFLEKRGKVQLDKTFIQEVMTQADRLLTGLDGEIVDSPTVRSLLLKLRRASHVDFGGTLHVYRATLNRVADRLGKEVRFVIDGDRALVDPDRLAGFETSLVNVLRNAVDHGIEAPEQRQELDKDMAGTVHCTIVTEPDAMVLTVRDDGGGIDFSAIREQAIESGVLNVEAAETATQDELCEILFKDRFSTRAKVENFSGRGIGLSAVRVELEKIGGKAWVTTERHVFSAFHFRIPFSKEERDLTL